MANDTKDDARALPNALTLSTLCNGALEELFQRALDSVLLNIDDPNTEAKAKRGIGLQVSFEVDDDRKSARIKVNATVKLAGTRPVGTQVRFGFHAGTLAAVEALPQESLFPAPEARPAVVEGGAR